MFNTYDILLNYKNKPRTFKEIIRMLGQQGWYLVIQNGSHRQYKHPSKKPYNNCCASMENLNHDENNSYLLFPGGKYSIRLRGSRGHSVEKC